MTIRHLGMIPSIHPDAYVAPAAVVSGQVSIGAGSCIMHGGVLAAGGGPVQVGAGCVIMENAVLRGTPRHPLRIGDRVLAGMRSIRPGRGRILAFSDPPAATAPAPAVPGSTAAMTLPPVRVRGSCTAAPVRVSRLSLNAPGRGTSGSPST